MKNITGTTFGEHVSLLAELARHGAEGVEVLLRQHDPDWDSFAQFIVWNQLSSYCLAVMSESTVCDRLPPSFVDTLAARQRKQAAATPRLLSELTRLSSIFHSADCQFILLKGPYLAHRFYGGIANRNFWDLDILIRRDEIARAQQLLFDAGFFRESPLLFSESLSRHFTHGFDFANEHASLDLHWEFPNHPSIKLNYDRIWALKQTHAINQTTFHVLNDEYALVFCLISILQDMERGALRMRSFVDLYLVLKEIGLSLEWDAFFDAREHEHLLRICLNVLACLLEGFQCRDDFSGLARAIQQRHGMLHVDSRASVLRLLEPSRLGVHNKIWASRLYECSTVGYLGWWAASLPFRLTVYNRGKKATGRGVR